MYLSTFDSPHAAGCNPVPIEWDALCSYLAAPPEYPSKQACPLFKLATFGTAPSPKGILRHDANVTAIYGVEGDHDAETMTPEEAITRMNAAGLTALVYTSPSHTPARPRWRVIVPTSQPYHPDARRELMGRVNAILGGTLATESFTLSQAYYFGRVAGTPYTAYASRGQFVDLVPIAPVFPRFQTGAGSDFDIGTGPVPEWRGPVDDAELLRRALQSRSAGAAFGARASFADLWDGNTEVLSKAFPDSASLFNASQADAALAAHLAFWTGRDGPRIERLMRQSKLARDKWEREDYLPRTISRILQAPGEVLTDKAPEPPATAQASVTAPSQVSVTGSTFLGVAEQRNLFTGCVYVQHEHKVLIPGGHMLNAERFKVAYGGYTFAMDTVNERTTRNAWEAFTESQALRAPRADTTCFRPDLAPAAIVDDAGRTMANTWWPANVPRAVGDVSPFLDLVAKLLPDERDRRILLSYMAACVQHKGVKFGWCPVLQGVEGNGKTTMSVCVAFAVGQRYVHWPKAKDIDSQFNAWVDRKVFIGLEELYSPEHQVDIVETLKTLISGGMGMQVQRKGVDQESLQIVANFIATTNHKGAVRKTPDNARRFATFYTAQQTYADLERDGMTGDYFPRLYAWLKSGGFAIVAELLHTMPIDPEFDPSHRAHRAPHTSTTDLAIVESMGSIEQQVAEVIAQDTPGFMGGWVSMVMLDRLLSDTLKIGHRISIHKRKDMLRAMGYILHPGLPEGRTNNPVQPDGKKPQLFIQASSPAVHLRGPAEIARAYTMAQTINPATLRY